MAKQRNSLGILTLVGTDEELISFDDYKKLTGIDLDKIVKVMNVGDTDNPVYAVAFKSEFRKIIALIRNEGIYSVLPPVSFPNKIVYQEDAELDKANIRLCVYDSEASTGYYFTIFANKTVQGGNL